MNLFRLISRVPSLAVALLFLVGLGCPAHAGVWDVVRTWNFNYRNLTLYSGNSTTITEDWASRNVGGPFSPTSYGVGRNSDFYTDYGPLEKHRKRYTSGTLPQAFYTGSVSTTIKWRRNPILGANGYFYDPNDNPPSQIYVREYATLSGKDSTGQPGVFYKSRARHSLSKEEGKWVKGSLDMSAERIRILRVTGDEVRVPTVTFKINTQLTGTANGSAGTSSNSYFFVNYQVEPLDLSLNVLGSTILSRKVTASGNQEIEALAGIRWMDPPVRQADGTWDKVRAPFDYLASLGGWQFGEQEGLLPPLPYFEGVADFDITASQFYNPQTYKWTPASSTDPLAPTTDAQLKINSTSDRQRTYTWNFGVVDGNTDPFPKNTEVSVEVLPGGGATSSDKIGAKAKIKWESIFSGTDTGLQKNTVSGPSDMFVAPDGSPVFLTSVKPGDTIKVYVKGDAGFSTDTGSSVSVRPVIYGQQETPGPDEHIEFRQVTSVTPMGDGRAILTFEVKPQVNPDDDPNAPGFDEIQQTRKIAAAIEQTNQTGQMLVGTAFTLEMELARAVSQGRLEGWGIEGSIKAVMALGKAAEALKAAKAGVVILEDAAKAARTEMEGLRALQKGGTLSASMSAKAEKDIAALERLAMRNEEAARSGRDLTQRGESYIASIQTEIRQGGCFVAGTRVWMADGTSQAIEQVKVGDLVISRDEKSGEVAAKKVTHTSIREHILTLKLTFEDGHVLETTDEHPLYVEGRGFAKAKEVGIGNSIVTRAGPSAKVTQVQADVRRATVYNFTVADFHTYFVGDAALWVHNQLCPIKPSADIWDHVRKGDGLVTPPGGFPRVPGTGVNGAHNVNEFFKQYVNTGEIRLLTGPPVPHPNLPGVYKYEYQIKTYDSAGNVTGWRTPSGIDGGTKTVYDPSIQNELDYFIRMTQARDHARQHGTANLNGGTKWRGQDGEGNVWEGFDNAAGEYRTGYPVW